MYALRNAVAKAGVTDVTAASILQALNTVKDVPMPFGPSWTPTAYLNAPNFERISGTAAWISVLNGTTKSLVSATPLNAFAVS
jgi:hypothetical protein